MDSTSQSEKNGAVARIQGMDIRDYLHILRKRTRLIATIIGLALLLALVKIFTTTPLYTASSQVLLERNTGGRGGLETRYYVYDPEFLETQSELIRSEKVALKVVRNLQLTTKFRHVFFPDDNKTPGLGETISQWLRMPLTWLKSLLTSNERKDAAESGQIGRVLSEDEIVALNIRSGLQVTPVRATKIVTISYTGVDPLLAQLVADAAVKAYMDEMLEMRLSFSSYALKWMTEKANEERKRLESSEGELQKFMRDNDLVTVENQLAVLPQRVADFGSQMTKLESERDALHEQIRMVQAAGGSVDRLETLPMFADNMVLKDIRTKIYAAQQTQHELSDQFGSKHPQMVKINAELRVLQSERRAEVDRVVASLTNRYNLAVAQVKGLSDSLKAAKSEMLDLQERFIEYTAMKRDADSNRVLFDALQTSIKKESVTEQAQDVNIWVLQQAQRPVAPSSPKKMRSLIMAFFIGLAGGLGLTFLLEYLDNTVKSHTELQQRYGLTVLGSIEELREKGQNIDNYLALKPLSPLAESYRLIRTALLLSSAEHPPRKILVTSMNPREGKTATTINIARTLAQSGSKVLVINCDLRRPRMNTVMGAQTETGLSTYLAGAHDKKVIVSVKGEQVAYMPSGPIPPNPAELLGSRRMRIMVEELASEYDFVLLDTPPVQSVTDGLMLTNIVDGAILVVRGGKTTFEALDSGIRKLKEVKANILGFVLNGVRGDQRGNYYYGYGSYYAKDKD
ncbi:MAG: polysaccharide biosynthesis tyrosine autokinase [Desulfobulbaceae bacterium]|jgi:capsular exopolysaccharide synthesis family protein|nr:polysaccharide biosynthesis tyrosine autokinase [Desulfobulbaceae bacterium]